MIVRIVITVFCLLAGTIQVKMPSAVKVQQQNSTLPVMPISVPEMPVQISRVTAESSIVSSWLSYSMSNMGRELIREVHFRVFLANRSGKLLTTAEGWTSEGMEAGASQDGRELIQEPIRSDQLAFVAVTKAVGNSGVWAVNEQSLERAVRARLAHQQETAISVKYESNVRVTTEGRSQIFKLVLEDILRNREKAERLGNASRVIVLRQSADFGLPQVKGAVIESLEHGEIKALAEKERRVVFITYEPLTSQGSRVLATIVLKDEVARNFGLHVPYRFTFLYWCRNNNGRWIIERSLGHS